MWDGIPGAARHWLACTDALLAVTPGKGQMRPMGPMKRPRAVTSAEVRTIARSSERSEPDAPGETDWLENGRPDYQKQKELI